MSRAIENDTAAISCIEIQRWQAAWLSPGNPNRGHHCDRMLIWVAKPTTSTCPEHKESAA